MVRIIVLILALAGLAALFGYGGAASTAVGVAQFVGLLLVLKIILGFVVLWMVFSLFASKSKTDPSQNT